jgi:hypothetical protein
MSTDYGIRVFAREMPLDGFTGMVDLNGLSQHLSAEIKLHRFDHASAILGMWEQVRAMQRELDTVQSRQDEEKTGEWVICLPVKGDPFAQPVAVVRKYSNNGNTYVATPHLELGFFMAFELIPLGVTSYDRFHRVEG